MPTHTFPQSQTNTPSFLNWNTTLPGATSITRVTISPESGKPYLTHTFNPTTGAFTASAVAAPQTDSRPLYQTYPLTSTGAVDEYGNIWCNYGAGGGQWGRWSCPTQLRKEIGTELLYRYTVTVEYETNRTPSTPGAFSQPSDRTVLRGGQPITIAHGVSSDPDGDSITYLSEVSYNGGNFGELRSITGTNFTFSIPEDPSITSVQFRVRARDAKGATSDYRTSSLYAVQYNAAPTLNLETTDNRTLYENDTFNLSGSYNDADRGNVVSVKYSIDNGPARALTSSISDGSPKSFNRILTYKNNKLHDGSTAVTNDLTEGSQHVVKVWSEDDKGGKSAEQLRIFYVVANRPPVLVLDPTPERTSLINSDVLTYTGRASDPDGNTLKVEYRVRNGTFRQIYSGSGGTFSFDVLVSELNDGDNSITVQSTDSYGAVTNKSLVARKTGTSVARKEAVQRYRINPPGGSAQGILLWIERETGDLIVSARISMTGPDEDEDFQPMTLSATAFVNATKEEDEFIYEAGGEKEKIIVELTLKRTSTTSDKGITLISGVLS